MRTIVSVDVGIVKLAFALFKQDEEGEPFLLDKWSVINLTQNTVDTVGATCCECVKKATCYKGTLHYCAKHGKKSGGLLPSTELKLSNINKLKKEAVLELIVKLGLVNDDYSSKNKKDLVSIVKDHLEKNVLTPIVKTNASKLDLNTIGRNIKTNFDEIFADDTCHIDEVIIENQIGPQAIRMKTIQGMLSQYFIMRYDNVSIKFVNASNKLKGETSSSIVISTYKDRKEMGIQMCKNIIQTDPYKKWTEFLDSKKKTTGIADLSDCFLQGLWYISTLK
jgi:hypothetical protein